MSPKNLAQCLRNAFQAQDRDEHEHALALMVRELEKAAGPRTQLAPCARGSACVCTTFEHRALCSYAPAKRGEL